MVDHGDEGVEGCAEPGPSLVVNNDADRLPLRLLRDEAVLRPQAVPLTVGVRGALAAAERTEPCLGLLRREAVDGELESLTAPDGVRLELDERA